MYWNSQGINNKREEFVKFIKSNSIDIICLCETFLKTSNRFSVNGYKCLRKDRISGRLGGLTMLVKNGEDCNEVVCPNTNIVE